MNSEIALMMKNFKKNISIGKIQLSDEYKKYFMEYSTYLLQYNGGKGMIGENSYLILWSQEEIEELNNDYEVKEFLSDIVLIGSDGGDMAYGVSIRGYYIEVPFIGMDNDEVVVIAKDFREFINYLFSQ